MRPSYTHEELAEDLKNTCTVVDDNAVPPAQDGTLPSAPVPENTDHPEGE